MYKQSKTGKNTKQNTRLYEMTRINNVKNQSTIHKQQTN